MGILADWQIARDVVITPFAEGEKREGVISYGNGAYGYDARIGYKFKVFSPVNCTEIDPKNFDPKALIEVDLTPRHHKWRYEKHNVDEAKFVCEECNKYYPSAHDREECVKSNFIRIPPYSYILGETVEEFDIPRDCLCLVIGKSTYARCGLIVNVTPGEPEWIGKWTVEISNPTPVPVRVYCGEGIMQCIFLRTDGYTEALAKTVTELLSSRVLGEPVMTARYHELLKNGTCRVSYKDKKGKYQGQTGLTLPTVDNHSDGKK